MFHLNGITMKPTGCVPVPATGSSVKPGAIGGFVKPSGRRCRAGSR
jgi:hypothetical protein